MSKAFNIEVGDGGKLFNSGVADIDDTLWTNGKPLATLKRGYLIESTRQGILGMESARG